MYTVFSSIRIISLGYILKSEIISKCMNVVIYPIASLKADASLSPFLLSSASILRTLSLLTVYLWFHIAFLKISLHYLCHISPLLSPFSLVTIQGQRSIKSNRSFINKF